MGEEQTILTRLLVGLHGGWAFVSAPGPLYLISMNVMLVGHTDFGGPWVVYCSTGKEGLNRSTRGRGATWNEHWMDFLILRHISYDIWPIDRPGMAHSTQAGTAPRVWPHGLWA